MSSAVNRTVQPPDRTCDDPAWPSTASVAKQHQAIVPVNLVLDFEKTHRSYSNSESHSAGHSLKETQMTSLILVLSLDFHNRSDKGSLPPGPNCSTAMIIWTHKNQLRKHRHRQSASRRGSQRGRIVSPCLSDSTQDYQELSQLTLTLYTAPPFSRVSPHASLRSSSVEGCISSCIDICISECRLFAIF